MQYRFLCTFASALPAFPFSACASEPSSTSGHPNDPPKGSPEAPTSSPMKSPPSDSPMSSDASSKGSGEVADASVADAKVPKPKADFIDPDDAHTGFDRTNVYKVPMMTNLIGADIKWDVADPTILAIQSFAAPKDFKGSLAMIT